MVSPCGAVGQRGSRRVPQLHHEVLGLLRDLVVARRYADRLRLVARRESERRGRGRVVQPRHRGAVHRSVFDRHRRGGRDAQGHRELGGAPFSDRRVADPQRRRSTLVVVDDRHRSAAVPDVRSRCGAQHDGEGFEVLPHVVVEHRHADRLFRVSRRESQRGPNRPCSRSRPWPCRPWSRTPPSRCRCSPSLNVTVNVAVPPSDTASASAIDRWRGSSLSRIVPSPSSGSFFRVAAVGSCSSILKFSSASWDPSSVVGTAIVSRVSPGSKLQRAGGRHVVRAGFRRAVHGAVHHRHHLPARHVQPHRKQRLTPLRHSRRVADRHLRRVVVVGDRPDPRVVVDRGPVRGRSARR